MVVKIVSASCALIYLFLPINSFAQAHQAIDGEDRLIRAIETLLQKLPELDASISKFGGREERAQFHRGVQRLSQELRSMLRTKERLLGMGGYVSQGAALQMDEEFRRQGQRIREALELTDPTNFSLGTISAEGLERMREEHWRIVQQFDRAFAGKSTAMWLSLYPSSPRDSADIMEKLTQSRKELSTALVKLSKLESNLER